jgi:hypothetical protein
MKQTRKRLRAQPRKATPPVSFRSEETGDRTIIMVDESFSTDSFTRTSTRQPIFLRLGPGLRVVMESRRIAKRRFAQLRIEALDPENARQLSISDACGAGPCPLS